MTLIIFHFQSAEGVNALDDNGELPLDLALRSGQKSLAQSLVEHGANVNQLNQDGVPLLNLAISRGDIFSSEFLIDNGAFSKLTSSSDGNHPLHLVAKDPQMISIASKLIAKGADINCINHSSMTPLHLCLESKNKDFFDYLTSLNDLKFEEKNINGLPPLWFALQDEDNFSFAEGLCSKGISLNTVCNSNGDSLLHLLANADLEKSCMFLINSSGCQTNLANIHGNTVLHLAAENGLLELAEALLEGPNASKEIIESQNVPDRQTPLHLAISKSHKTVVNAILAFCSTNCKEKNEATNFNLKNSFGQTPLSLALSKNLHEVAMRLIESGANVNICDSTGLTLLHLAIMDGNESGSIFLMNHGADIDMRTSNGETPLELAIANRLPIVLETLCRKASLDLAHVLLRYGVDTDSWSVGPGGCYQTLLHRAIDENMDEAAKFLIRSGCDLLSPRKLGPNGQGGEEARDMSSPLNLCCRWGQAGIVEVLLEHEAPINSRDAEGKTPIHVAIEEGDTSIINILLDHQPNLTLRDNSDIEPTAAEIYDSRGRNFLHTAILRKDLESVLFLISIKANIHSITQDSNRLSPLLLAVQLGNDMIVRNLLLAGASVSDVSGCGQTALHIASEHNFPLIVGILLSNGIDFTIVDNRGNNALHIAVKEGHSEVVRTLLLESQIDAEALNNKGRNPLHILANFGGDSSSKIFDIFLKYMHDYPIDKPDAEGNTPLLLAYMKGNGNLCRSLVKNGAILGSINHDGTMNLNGERATFVKNVQKSLASQNENIIAAIVDVSFVRNALTNTCPILKYNLPKPVRVCDVCADILTIGPNGSLKATSDESIERLNSDDNLSNRTFVLDGDSTDDEELNPCSIPHSKKGIQGEFRSIAKKNNAIQSANSESTKSIVISGIKEIDAVTINSHGFGILGHTPGYKTTILQEYLSSLPDLIFIQDSIYIEDMKEILDSICPNTYDHQFSNDPSEINKIDDKDEDKSITGVIWKTDKYSKSSLLLGSSSPTHPFNSKLSIVKLDSKVEKKSQDSLGNDMYPSMICASWHGPDYSTPLRSRVHTLKEVLKYLNKLRPLNSWFPILLGGDFNMDIMKNSEDLNKEFFFVSYRPTSGTMLKDLKTTFAFNWDYLLATETRVKHCLGIVIEDNSVMFQHKLIYKIRGKNRVKLWAIIRIQRFFRSYLKRKKCNPETVPKSPIPISSNESTQEFTRRTSYHSEEESRDYRRKRFSELKSIHQRRKEREVENPF
ncbi:ANKFY1 [Lepeophtheirus salmonis]|uniref:ANKFY1 n=1 Tax=Lepeophtheirus salmonis TaxID=72036 RepID=A0A7R8H7X7_LEPSM|nr:ANKFY1 [Lepeophtheirus salmonis]CAF2928985.1 ANKFY1 [Lepeophtheirus salmonis]